MFNIDSLSSPFMFVVELTMGNVVIGQFALPPIFIVVLRHISLDASCLRTYQSLDDCTITTVMSTHPKMRNTIAELCE